MQENRKNNDSISEVISNLLIKINELQISRDRLKYDSRYRNGWDFPEYEMNLNQTNLLFDNINENLNNLSDMESKKLWKELEIGKKSFSLITDMKNWSDLQYKHFKYIEKQDRIEEIKLKRGYYPKSIESDEDRIMRRLRNGNGDLEGF